MTPPRRIFFALWPEPGVARQLDALAGAAHAVCGGRRMRRDTLHLTLAFLGDVADAQFDSACEAADEVAEKVGDAGTRSRGPACGDATVEADAATATSEFGVGIPLAGATPPLRGAPSAASGRAGDAPQEVPLGDTPLRIDRIAHWKHNHIVWAGCDAVPAALATLAAELAAALRRRGFRLDSRPFAAHVTLLRNARCDGELPALAPFDWSVRDFVLVRSHLDAAGARYEIVGRWAVPSPTAPPRGAASDLCERGGA